MHDWQLAQGTPLLLILLLILLHVLLPVLDWSGLDMYLPYLDG